MTIQVDPEQNEILELRKAADWVGKDVLEVGCGDGRLASRLASLGASVSAIDPNLDQVKSALPKNPDPPGKSILYSVADGRRLPFPAAVFDIVIFGWSL